jgi:hypothetical protein
MARPASRRPPPALFLKESNQVATEKQVAAAVSLRPQATGLDELAQAADADPQAVRRLLGAVDSERVDLALAVVDLGVSQWGTSYTFRGAFGA